MAVVEDVTSGLAAAIDALGALDPTTMADADTVVALHRQLARLEALTTRMVAGFDAGRSWDDDGARSAASWLAAHCSLPSAVTRRRVGLGRDLRSMPEVEAAWMAGDINVCHVAPLAAARRRSADEFARDEQALVGHARKLRYGQFVKALAYWTHLADPDGVEADATSAFARRRFHWSQGFEGQWFGDALSDPISGAIVDKVLRSIYDELFAEDWAEARARVGEPVTVDDLARTPAQRRHDALVEMARRAAAVPDGARLPEPLFTVKVGLDSFKRVCELWNGTVVAPGSLVRWLDEAQIERMIFDTPSRVIDVGRRRRIFSGATRRAVEVRDDTCSHPCCEVPAEECEIDHVQPFAQGGTTTTDNGRPACRYHNQWRQRRGPPPG